MNDDAAEIDEHPIAIAIAFYMIGGIALLFQLLFYRVNQCLNVGRVVAVCDQEIISDDRDLVDIQNFDILAKLVIQRAVSSQRQIRGDLQILF